MCTVCEWIEGIKNGLFANEVNGNTVPTVTFVQTVLLVHEKDVTMSRLFRQHGELREQNFGPCGSSISLSLLIQKPHAEHQGSPKQIF